MFKLQWDETGKREYEIGVSKGVLYTASEKDPYGFGEAWNGLTNITESPEGAEITDLYADGIKYASLRSTETYKTTVEAYMYPDTFAECDGSVEIAPGVFAGQQPRKTFGLCYRSEKGSDTMDAGELGYKLHLVYGATASPSERTHATINDSPDVETMSWEVNTTPVPVPGKKPTACLTIDSTKVKADELAKLEEILYGKGPTSTDNNDGVEPRLPLPSEVISMFTVA